MEPIKLLLNLDDLYETRLSLMASISTHKAMDAIKAGYGTRKSDHIIWESLGITEEQWRERYRKRGDEILIRATRTKFYNFLVDLIRDADSTPRENSEKPNVEIIVNEFPYSLDKEVKKVQMEVMRELLGNIPIKFIRKAPLHLSPKFLLSTCTHVVMYEFTEWFLMHENTDEPANLLQLEFILPALLRDLPTKADAAEFEKIIEEVGILGVVEEYIAPGMTIRYIEADYFNAPN